MVTGGSVEILKRLRVIGASAKAVATALTTLARGGVDPGGVSLAPGDVAPDFTLTASDGRTYRLSDFRGRQIVVVAWFPKAFTGGCTAECESIGGSGQALSRLNAAYFGASVDSRETNRRFAASMGIQFPILSDPDKSAARAYGVLRFSGFPNRWTFYIGLDGRILAIDKDVRTATHGADIANRLTEWQTARQI